jgi:L-aspartate oxidase
MEFVQFHPTVLDVEGAPRFLLSEALRGEGAHLVDASATPFMSRYHPSGDLAPRDVVSRSIVRESQRTGGPVFLSLRHLDPDEVHRRFPTIASTCLKAGFDLARDLLPVGPAAHYLMGGVETDLEGRTSVPGLFAAGEVACTRVHGANRLASNSLLEGLVFGARAGRAMTGAIGTAELPPPVFDAESAAESVLDRMRQERAPSLSELTEPEIRALMWKSVGLFRDQISLVRACRVLHDNHAALETTLARDGVLDHEGWRHASILTVAWLIARAALRREESRGGHFRTDFPARDDLKWKVHVSDTFVYR